MLHTDITVVTCMCIVIPIAVHPCVCMCVIVGVTQELIDETRLSTEKMLLDDLQSLAQKKQDLEFKGRSGETPVSPAEPPCDSTPTILTSWAFCSFSLFSKGQGISWAVKLDNSIIVGDIVLCHADKRGRTVW